MKAVGSPYWLSNGREVAQPRCVREAATFLSARQTASCSVESGTRRRDPVWDHQYRAGRVAHHVFGGPAHVLNGLRMLGFKPARNI